MKVNMHTSHPSAFISSTFVDLYEDRNAIADALKSRGLNVNALDIRPASSQSSKKEIQNGIRESDFVILLIGDRFGSILKSMTGNESQSITWWEYTTALKMGKPVIAYFKNVDESDPKSHDDKSDPLYSKKRVQFERFKKQVTNRHNPSFYSDPYDLAEQLDESLISIYRAGVKDLCSKNSELNNKISQLETELSTLKSSTTTATLNPSNNSIGGLLSLGLNQQQTDTEKQVQGLMAALNKSKT
jgi:nucleoside 2-deoxyribosyltransferase